MRAKPPHRRVFMQQRLAAAPEPLTASFEGLPAEHAGQGSFSFRVAFSEGIISATRRCATRRSR